MNAEQIAKSVEGIEVVNGIWLDRAGFFGATIRIMDEVAELRFEAASFVWNMERSDRVKFIFVSDNKVVCINRTQLRAWDKLLEKLRVVSSPKVYAEFSGHFF